MAIASEVSPSAYRNFMMVRGRRASSLKQCRSASNSWLKRGATSAHTLVYRSRNTESKTIRSHAISDDIREPQTLRPQRPRIKYPRRNVMADGLLRIGSELRESYLLLFIKHWLCLILVSQGDLVE